MSLALAIAVSLAVVLFVLLPLLRGAEAPLHPDEGEDEVDARRRVALRALRDVEYDYVTGKLDDEDYRSLRDELSREALRALGGGGGGQGGPGAGPDGVEAELLALRRALREGRLCRSCGRANRPGSDFCGACGRPLGEGGPGHGTGAGGVR